MVCGRIQVATFAVCLDAEVDAGQGQDGRCQEGEYLDHFDGRKGGRNETRVIPRTARYTPKKRVSRKRPLGSCFRESGGIVWCDPCNELEKESQLGRSTLRSLSLLCAVRTGSSDGRCGGDDVLEGRGGIWCKRVKRRCSGRRGVDYMRSGKVRAQDGAESDKPSLSQRRRGSDGQNRKHGRPARQKRALSSRM